MNQIFLLASFLVSFGATVLLMSCASTKTVHASNASVKHMGRFERMGHKYIIISSDPLRRDHGEFLWKSTITGIPPSPSYESVLAFYIQFFRMGQSGELNAIKLSEADSRQIKIRYRVWRLDSHERVMYLESSLDEWCPYGTPGPLDNGRDERGAIAYYVDRYNMDLKGEKMDREYKKGNIDLAMISQATYDLEVSIDVRGLGPGTPDCARVVFASHFN